jgi:ABC-2 type transport system permease protein
MGLFAKEKRERTFELLMTVPLRPWEIVAGKYLSGVLITGATLGSTLVFPLILAAFGSSESGQALEWQTVFLGFGGLILLGALSVALTMVISSFIQTEFLAGFMGIVLMLAWLFLRAVGQNVDEPFRTILGQVSLDTHVGSLMRGLVEVKGLVMFASGIAVCLFLTHRKVEAERWA